MAVTSILVLGPIQAVIDGRMTPIAGRKARAILVALILAVDHAVATDRLVDAVWGGDAPRTAHDTLHTHVSRLRHLLGWDTVIFEDDAYALRCSPDDVDLVRFERLAAAAEATLPRDPERARDLAMEGLALWRGPVFGDIGDEEFARLESERLEEMRASVMEIRLEADVATGRYVQAIGLLRAAVGDYPYRERLWYLLMSALARDGRRVEALRAYRCLCDLLAEIGLEPSAELRALEEEILSEAPERRPRLARSGHRE